MDYRYFEEKLTRKLAVRRKFIYNTAISFSGDLLKFYFILGKQQDMKLALSEVKGVA
jgi:hypothetical protein